MQMMVLPVVIRYYKVRNSVVTRKYSRTLNTDFYIFDSDLLLSIAFRQKILPIDICIRMKIASISTSRLSRSNLSSSVRFYRKKT